MTATNPQPLALPKKAPPPTKLETLASLLEAQKANLAQVLPKHLTADRLVKIAIAAISRTPKLMECTPSSIYYSLALAAQLGLEAGGILGHFYLIPRRNKNLNAMECTPLVGYKGFCELARRSGRIARLDAHLVYEGEEFEYDQGTGKLRHPWRLDTDRTPEKIVAAWALAKSRDSDEPTTVVLTRAEIEARRARAMAREEGPWVTDYPAMARKSGLRALFGTGLVPLSATMARAIEEEDRLEMQPELLALRPVPTDEPRDEPAVSAFTASATATAESASGVTITDKSGVKTQGVLIPQEGRRVE